jgi:hypothetical protein
MPIRTIRKKCRHCRFPCARDAIFEENNIPTIITTEYEDQCGCRVFCSYPNNVCTIVLAQLLTLMAISFTVYTTLDCRFIKGPSAEIDAFTLQFLFNNTVPEDFEYKPSELRGLGFFSWEAMDGTCSSEYYIGSNLTYADLNNNTYSVRDIACSVYYARLVGTDWKMPRAMAVLSSVVAFVAVTWMLILSCVANKRRYRAILAILLMIVLPMVQSLTFLVFRTDYCVANDCEYGGSSRYATAAVVAYFLSGVLLCVGTTDFPGNPYTKRRRPPHCDNLLCCRNACRQLMKEPDEPEQHQTEAVASATHPLAEVTEVPVEPDFFDTSLIDGDAVVSIPAEPVEISVASLTPPWHSTPRHFWPNTGNSHNRI